MTTDIIEQLAAALAGRIASQIPVDVDLWDSAHIASYLKRSPQVVAERIVCLPGFPQAIRLPTAGKGRGQPLWRAAEVIEWVGKHQEKRVA